MLSRFLLVFIFGCLPQMFFGQAGVDAGKASATATVYIYRLDYDPFVYSFLLSRRLSVKFAAADRASKDLPQIASLRNKHYLILKLAPGSYLFDTRNMHDKYRLDLASGDERYLRWDQGSSCPTEEPSISPPCQERTAGIHEMAGDVGRSEISKMKPIGKSDVKERALVTIPPK